MVSVPNVFQKKIKRNTVIKNSPIRKGFSKKMKRLTILLVVLCSICFSLNFSNVQASQSSHNPSLKIVTTLPLVKNITQKIAGNQVTVASIINGPNCDHEYEPTAKEMQLIANCDLFVKLGMESDHWADKLTGITKKQTIILDCSSGVETIKVHGQLNPHYWNNPANVKIMAKNILAELIKLKPSQKQYFSANYTKYLAEIDQTVNRLTAQIKTLPDKKIVSYSNAFPYLFESFGFKNLMTVELSCEQEVSPKDLVRAVTIIKKEKIKVLIGNAAEPKEPEPLAKEAKIKLVLLWPSTDASGDYLITLKNNLNQMVAALK